MAGFLVSIRSSSRGRDVSPVVTRKTKASRLSAQVMHLAKTSFRNKREISRFQNEEQNDLLTVDLNYTKNYVSRSFRLKGSDNKGKK